MLVNVPALVKAGTVIWTEVFLVNVPSPAPDIAVAAAPVPPPPVNEIAGALVHPRPAVLKVIEVTTPEVRAEVATED